MRSIVLSAPFSDQADGWSDGHVLA